MYPRYDFVWFTTSFLCRTMRPYLDIWAMGTGDHSQGALGALAGAVSTEIKSYIENVLKIDKNCLQKRGSFKVSAIDEHPFMWIAKLESAVVSHLLRQYNEVPGHPFAGAFNEHVTAAPAMVVKEVPLLLKSIQSQLHVLTPIWDRKSIMLSVRRPPSTQPDCSALNIVGTLMQMQLVSELLQKFKNVSQLINSQNGSSWDLLHGTRSSLHVSLIPNS
jgi:hypothetical protein